MTTSIVTPNLKQVADHWKTITIVVGSCVVAFFVAPIIYTIIGGMIGIAVAAILVIVLFPLLIVLGSWVANQKIKMLKWVAAQSPVEAMQNVYLARQKNLKDFELKVQGLGSGLKTYRNNLADMKKRWPKDDYTDRDQEEQQFGKIYNMRLDQITEKRQELSDYADDIDKTEAEWKIGVCASNVQEAAGMTEEDFEQRMTVKAAKAAVTDKINDSFAAMDIALLSDKVPVITIQQAQLKQPQSP